MKHNIFLVAMLAAFLALAGCGGGSSSTTEPVDPGPSPEDTEAMALAAAQGAADTAATNAETAATMAAADVMAIIGLDGEGSERAMAAQGIADDVAAAAARARTASDNAAAATTSTAAAAFQATAEAEATTAASLRTSVGNLLAAAQQADAAEMAKMIRDAATEVAETKEEAIAAEAAQGADGSPSATLHADAGLGGTNATDGTAVTTYSMMISRDRSATKITISDTALAGDDDPKFAQAMDLGGGTTMHVREMEADDDGNVKDEVVIVTTDIEAPKGVPFAMFEAADGTNPQALNADADGATQTVGTDAAVAFDPGGALVSTDPTQAAILANIMAADFAPGTGASVVHTFNAAVEDDVNTTEVDESMDAAEVMGTYNGASGTYKCSGATDCTVTVNDEGELTAASDGWIFTPAMGATSDQPDYEYYHYGFWLARTKDSDGHVTSYDEVETFAGSSVAASGAVSSVLGSASYSGGATGVYVHSETNTDGSRHQATSGHFTADANLSATFGQVPVSSTDSTGTIAPNMLNTLTGTINNFALSGEEEQSWSVALSGDITDTDGTSTGTAKGGMGDGSYSATFHGSVTAGADGTVPHPHSVVGEFNAGFTNGSVAGAFGARVDD